MLRVVSSRSGALNCGGNLDAPDPSVRNCHFGTFLANSEQNGQEKQSSTHDLPSLIKIDRSDQNTAVVLELACKYLVGQYALDFWTVLLKNPLQIGWAERLERSSELFKGRTTHSTSSSPFLMMSIEPDRLGKWGPKEVILKFNRTGHCIHWSPCLLLF